LLPQQTETNGTNVAAGQFYEETINVHTALLPYTLIVAPCISGRDNLQSDAGHCNSARQTGGSRPHNEAGCEYDVHNQLVSTERRTLDAICKQHLTNRGMQLAVHIRLLQ